MLRRRLRLRLHLVLVLACHAQFDEYVCATRRPPGPLEAQDLEARDAPRRLAYDGLDVPVPPAAEALVVGPGGAVQEPVHEVPDAAAVLEEEDPACVGLQRGCHQGEERHGILDAAEAEALQDRVILLGDRPYVR